MASKDQINTLMSAVKNGDLATVRHLIEEESVPVDVLDGTETALARAAIAGQCSIADYLISKGANIDTRNSKGNTPLIHAAYHGHMKMTKLLLRRGADALVIGSDGTNPKGISSWANSGNNPDISKLIKQFRQIGIAALNDDAPAVEESDIWRKTGDAEVEHVYYRQDGGLRITDIFNFADREHSRHTQDIRTGALTTIIRNFSELEGTQSLRQAYNTLVTEGGTPGQAHMHYRRVLRRRNPSI
ncbi:MAG: ankyrin repeat domain-containing protein [Pseudomonadota bacterium]|nr:ankyrin repeat domain-containing protein [Pseudomonadota bacterium]QKK05056.1 MAG: ankyrin repeat domain-containing protein [Pseudomonadota bacterium]